MKGSSSKYEIDMMHGSMFPKLVQFAIPLALTSLLQLLYNAADVIVVGRFEGPLALAAVGSTGALINLIVNVFLGLSVGTNVVASMCFGSGDKRGMHETVHTSIAISLVGGAILGLFGCIFGGTFLKWMGSPDDVLPYAAIYIKIYFIGMPFNMLYNFGAAVLRAVGDTRRPLYFLTISGMVNVVLNLFFVVMLKIGIAGVAWATIISQMLSSAMVTLCLMRSEGYTRLILKELKIYPDKLLRMMRIGLPAGLQGACFSFSNVLIQSTINSYGSIVVAGNSAAQNLEGFIYVSMNSVHQAAVTFVSANNGAKKNRRIRMAFAQSVLLVTMIGCGLGILFYLFRRSLIGIYNTDAVVIEAGARRLAVIASTYFLCGIMDVLCGVLRGLGSTVLTMIVSVIGACGFRIFWIACILPLVPDPEHRLMVLYYSYPISWILTGGTHLLFCIRKLKNYPILNDES